ncbi:hypothetical protein COEREDRAFT_8760 [Coemansia reversa NRRL 1564]|uniref:PH domain-containing protein n=1 Tax=Coemansia reversa (strain ATCC 12441 / NRRL 1564) TaxID=763665 RepID=A0A2G5BAT4_COERN|nr:hypothetical protein COEREDRAFT_8760 [Coemansia reversa NRRL 1564]|eukprot:PIA16102.1 hypothetical protein COEREDRAFT_8760 [Coemansia reversa NRRL 1564]
MGLSSASRRFKTLRRKQDRLPIGTIIDNASYPQASANEPPPNAGHSSLGYGAPGYGPQDYSSPGYISPGHAVQNYPPQGYNSVGPNAQGYGSPNRVAGVQNSLSRSSSLSSPGPGLVSVPSDINSRMAMTGSASQGDLVVFRLNSWITLVKQYSGYLQAFVTAQKTAKKALEKSAEDLDVPLKGEHCFLGVERNGVQRMSAHLKDVHQMYSTHYARLVQNIETNALDQLESLRAEIKDSLKEYVDHLGPIYKRLRKQAKEAEVYKQKLVRAVEAYKKRHRGNDAWLIQQQVRRELTQQAELENALCKAMQAEHTRLFRWESTLTGRLRDIIASALVCERDSLQTTLGTIANGLWFLEKFDTATESQAFNHHCGSVFRTPLGLSGNSTLEDYDYMYRDSEPTTVLLEGPLERERGVLKRFQHTYVVLTTQGYLHCYSDQRDLLERNPDASFHLPDCCVTPLDDKCMFMVNVNDKKLGRSKYAFRTGNPSSTEHWINALSCVAAPPKSPEPQEQQVVGGTLRNSSAAMAAAAAAADAPNTLPTAAGIPANELSARNAAEDAQTKERSTAAEDAPSADKSPAADSANSEESAKSPEGNKQPDAGEDTATARAPPAEMGMGTRMPTRPPSSETATDRAPPAGMGMGTQMPTRPPGSETATDRAPPAGMGMGTQMPTRPPGSETATDRAPPAGMGMGTRMPTHPPSSINASDRASAAAMGASASKNSKPPAKAAPGSSTSSFSSDGDSDYDSSSDEESASNAAANRAKALALSRSAVISRDDKVPSAAPNISGSSKNSDNVVKALEDAGLNSSVSAEDSKTAALRAQALAAAKGPTISRDGDSMGNAPVRGGDRPGTRPTTASTSASNGSKPENGDGMRPFVLGSSRPGAMPNRMPMPNNPDFMRT